MKHLLTLAAAFLGLSVAAQAAAKPGEPKRLIVVFADGIGAEGRQGALEKFSMKQVEDLGAFNAVLAEAPSGKYAPSSLRMMSDPGILLAEEDFYTNWIKAAAPSFQQVPLPSLAETMAQLKKFEKKDASSGEIPWGVARVHAEKAWPLTQGEGVKVAVVDTGIDCSHPDLKGQCAGGVNYVDKDKPPMDDNSHGTHVAGTIAAVKDGQGVVGVAPKARLYAVKVLDAEGGGSLFSIIKGLLWCGNNGMQVANLSLGAPMGSTLMRLAVAYAKARGVVVMAAAGNDGGSVNYPAAYDDTLAVAALDPSDKIADFSSRGPEVDFIAPGVNVKSSVPGGKYDWYDGTSMATPHMTGLAALAVAKGAKGFEGVRSALKKAAVPVAGLSAEQQGAGVVDAGKLAGAK